MKGTAIDWVDDLFHLFGRDPPPNFTLYLALTVILLPIPVVLFFIHSARPRQGLVPPYRERVLILGASSGVGEQLAYQYSHRGCRNLVLVARRKDELERVKAECDKKRKEGEEWDQSQQAPGWEDVKETVTIIEADCTKAEDLIKIRQTIRKSMGGLDTLHIVFGVSALKSLLGVAGVEPKTTSQPYASLEGVQATLEAASKIHHINVASTAAALATFIPLLQLTSPAPSIILLSSVAALVPPPTRSLYAASKAAQLQLFQAVRVESQAQVQFTASSTSPRKEVKFLAMAPATIRTAFRLGAVDGPPDPESSKDSSWDSSSTNSKGKSDILEPQDVAYASIKGADRMEEGIQTMPGKYRLVQFAQLIVPSIISNMARKKYGY